MNDDVPIHDQSEDAYRTGLAKLIELLEGMLSIASVSKTEDHEQ